MNNNPNRPQVWKPNRSRQTSTLFFRPGVDHEFYVRAAVCWPFYSPRDNRVRGYAIVAGMSTADRRIRIFEEMDFFDIDNTITQEEAIYGFAQLASVAWTYYGCKRWFDRLGSDEKWRVRVRQSVQVEPRPAFQDVTVEGGAYQDFVLRYIQSTNLEYAQHGGIHLALEEMRQTDNLSYADFPELAAAGLLLAGLEEYPWRGYDQPHDFPSTRSGW